MSAIRKTLCVLGFHEWRSWEEAKALRTLEACKHCVGWRFFVPSPRSAQSASPAHSPSCPGMNQNQDTDS